MRPVQPHVMIIGVAVLFAASCGRTSPPSNRGVAEHDDRFVPGLGELMSAQQMRHVKLWFAGEAENWALADYELDKLGERFDDIVTFHPMHKDSPVAPKDAIPRIATTAIKPPTSASIASNGR